MDNKLTIKKYLKKGKFVIPNYQRGFKWGEPNNDHLKECSVGFFCDSLIKAFKRNDEEYFIEAITAVEDDNRIILVDGQQRTTTLFLIFIALEQIEYLKSIQFKLVYDVRKDSDNFLNNLLLGDSEKTIIEDENTQDIHYFTTALKKIREKFKKLEEERKIGDFVKFLNDKVWLLYNVIEETKAITTFISLNGLKAVMKDEELIKSDLLIKSSRYNKPESNSKEELIGFEWKINEDRSRLAHNWDKWLYWWNREDVKKYFGTENRHPLYFLLVTYWNSENSDENKKFDFDNFKSKFIKDNVSAKNTFEKLRKLQKSFEDTYNNPISFNYLGIALKTTTEKEKTIAYFLNEKEEKKREEYTLFVLVNSTHLESINKTKEKDQDVEIRILKAKEAINLVNEKFVYNSAGNEFAFRFLLLLNVIEDNKLNRKFNFNIWNERSLEHIHPKSKAYYKDGGNFKDGNNNDLGSSKPNGKEWLNRDEINENGSEHCIGNLVLLYGKNNSSFGAKTFEEKKQTYFETSSDLKFESRGLLHTFSIFASSEWNAERIAGNKIKIIKNLENIYNGFY
ncbi:DUF262 domain-containing protein [Flavobacterium sp. A45]|uniref:DUF262 domain-containing protein n=1 Tax=Flavobacterium sp. A45 TaxID=1945862 RepID=UPI0009862FC9|nr:DUF262 domain-containing protein [Flavobacterium sp. A45]OOG78168.1 hypothetical protein B0E44_01475 [Flavobacterium sp. A45]